MSDSDNYTGVLLEQIRDQNQAVLEAVGQMQEKMQTLATQESLDELSATVGTIQAAIKGTNEDVAQLDSRLTALEQAHA